MTAQGPSSLTGPSSLPAASSLISPRRLIMHDIPLTQDPALVVRLTLPRDLTQQEADRLCLVIQALALS